VAREPRSRAEPKDPDRRHTAGFLVVLVLLLLVAAALPFALGSVIADVRDSSARVYSFDDASPSAGVTYRVDVDVVSLNDSEGTVTLRATATRNCYPNCSETARLAFLSAVVRGPHQDLLPVQQWLIFPQGIDTAAETIRLPVAGDPLHYPFDSWQLALVIVAERVAADGNLIPLAADDPDGAVALTIESRAPRLQMLPGPDLRAQYGVDLSQYRALYQSFDFERPLYLKLLTVSLVLLVTAAAAYAVVLRPLDQLMIQVGAIVLGIWGVRAILLGTGLSVVTLVDLVLMSVILFLLAIITLRTLWLMEARSHVRLFRRTLPPPPADAKADDARPKEEQPAKVPDLVPSDQSVERVPTASNGP
jgi:hypothetical protein